MTYPQAPHEVSLIGHMLRKWRVSKGLSQNVLGRAAGVSTRHISFLETGRAQPSREMVLRLGEAMQIPLREQNPLLVAAGFAPVFSEHPLESPRAAPIDRAFRQFLDLPYPGVLVDRLWNIQAENAIHRALREELTLEPPEEGPENVLRLWLSPTGLRRSVVNWSAAARSLWARFDRQVSLAGTDRVLATLRDELLLLPGVRGLTPPAKGKDRYDLAIPLELTCAGETLAWYCAVTRLAAPRDITLQELRVEILLPANPAAEAFCRAVRKDA